MKNHFLNKLKAILSAVRGFCESDRKIDFLLAVPFLAWLSDMQQRIIFLVSPSYRMAQRTEQMMKRHYLESKSGHLSERRHSAENKVAQEIRAALLHQKTFSKYKNIHQRRDVVLIATGPSLQLFQPIDGAVYIGVNTAFKYDKVNLDYYFTQDFSGMKQHIDELGAYVGNNVKKFYGIPDESSFDLSIQIPESIAVSHGAERYYGKDCKYCMDVKECRNYIHNRGNGEKLYPFTFPHDISLAPLADYHSIVFPALQFALYTHPKRLYLVGCDCNHAGYFNNQAPSRFLLELDIVKFGYSQLKIFADHYYPDTEVISINPCGLKGLFTDIFTAEYTEGE